MEYPSFNVPASKLQVLKKDQNEICLDFQGTKPLLCPVCEKQMELPIIQCTCSKVSGWEPFVKYSQGSSERMSLFMKLSYLENVGDCPSKKVSIGNPIASSECSCKIEAEHSLGKCLEVIKGRRDSALARLEKQRQEIEMLEVISELESRIKDLKIRLTN